MVRSTQAVEHTFLPSLDVLAKVNAHIAVPEVFNKLNPSILRNAAHKEIQANTDTDLDADTDRRTQTRSVVCSGGSCSFGLCASGAAAPGLRPWLARVQAATPEGAIGVRARKFPQERGA